MCACASACVVVHVWWCMCGGARVCVCVWGGVTEKRMLLLWHRTAGVPVMLRAASIRSTAERVGRIYCRRSGSVSMVPWCADHAVAAASPAAVSDRVARWRNQPYPGSGRGQGPPSVQIAGTRQEDEHKKTTKITTCGRGHPRRAERLWRGFQLIPQPGMPADGKRRDGG